MSQPFAVVVGQRAKQYSDAELSERAFSAFNRWALLSASKMVSLDEVSWIGAVFVKAMKAVGHDLLKNETRDENGARVVGIVASDGVKVADGAG